MTDHDGVREGFDWICKDVLDDPKYRTVDHILTIVAELQADARLEMKIRAFLDADETTLDMATDDLSKYTEELYYRASRRNGAFSYDDMQLVVEGVRTRIEGGMIS